MTMDADPQSVEYLSSVLFEANKPITYVGFSRTRQLHVNRAKVILYEFYKANSDRLQGTFIVTGVAKDGSTLIRHAKTENSLAETTKLFETVHTIHIYLVSAKDLRLTTTDIALEDTKHRIDHQNIADYEKLGLIRGPKLVVTSAKNEPRPQQVSSSIDQPAASKPTKLAPKPEKSAGLTSGYVSRKAAAAQNANSKSSKSSASSKPTKPASTYQYQSRKAAKREPAERVVASVPDDDPEEVEELETAPRKKPQTDLNQLFMDDFSDDEPEKEEEDTIMKEDIEPTKAASPEPEPPKPPADVGAMEPSPADEAAAATTNFDEVDEDGYIVARKPAEPKKALARAPPSLARASQAQTALATRRTAPQKPAGKKQKTQLSLMNFFGGK